MHITSRMILIYVLLDSTTLASMHSLCILEYESNMHSSLVCIVLASTIVCIPLYPPNRLSRPLLLPHAFLKSRYQFNASILCQVNNHMGGHSAWRKRVANGELAKGLGGAICRHRPHLGRKGKERVVERKGNINGGPRKNKKKKDKIDLERKAQQNSYGCGNGSANKHDTYGRTSGMTCISMVLATVSVVSLVLFVKSLVVYGGRLRNNNEVGGELR